MTKVFKLSLGAIALTAMAACTSAALTNPDFFSFSVKGGVLSGQYNPAGYTGEQVQERIKVACQGDEIADYSESDGKKGLIAFTARCPQGAQMTLGTYEVQRTATGTYSYETFGL